MDVPPELASLPNWVRWDENKVPLQADGITRARSNDPTTWARFDDVKAFDRIGFMFRKEDGLVGIDLDGAIVGSSLADWAQEIVEDFASYTEISPSGTGVHIFCKGDWPANGWHKIKIGEKPTNGSKQPGVEVYNHERYFTFTSNQISDSTALRVAGDALQRLFAKHHKKKQTATSSPKSSLSYQHTIQTPLDERIRSYMARLDVSISGQHGHDRLLWAARCLVTGFNLSEAEAVGYLTEWNLSCLPPWPESEVVRKVNQAATTPCDKPEGWLLVDNREKQPSNVDISGLLSQPKVIEPIKPDPKQLANVFPADCLRPPGLIGEIVDYTLATAYDPQPELALSGAIAMMSLLCGQKVVDKRNTRPNVYVIGVEKTSAGKDAARMTNKKILTAIQKEDLTEDNVGSDSGLTKYIAEVPNCLLQIDEIHHMLVSMRNTQTQPHMVAVGRELLTLFPASQTFYKTKLLASTKRVTIRYPNVVLYGTCTTNGFWENITRELIEGGLLGRCMVFEGRGYVASQEPSQQSVPQSILDQATHWLDLKTHSGDLAGTAGQAHTPLIVMHTLEAWERSSEHRDNINKKVMAGEDDFRAAIWKRTAERTNKLALLFACSRSGGQHAPSITLDDVNLAIKTSNWLTNMMLVKVGLYVAESDFERDCLRVIRFVEQRGIVTGYEMLHSPSPLKKLKPNERKDVLATLQESGSLFVEPQNSSGGRPGVLYYSRDQWTKRLAEQSLSV